METSLVYKAFETVYWIIKEEVANKVLCLLKLIERLGVSDMRLFDRRSHPSVQEILF